MGTNLGGLRYGYLLYVNTTRSTLYSDKVNNFFGSWEAGADGDVWELQVWGPPAATWLRGIRNGRILFTIKDTITPLANIPINGVGGVALGNGVAGSWTMTHFESGNLRENFDGDILPDLVPTWIPATATDTLMGQIIL
jgi:hypothetical protein